MVASPSHGSFGNDEDVWFGGDDHAAEARAEQSVAAVGARIIGAKPFPVAARRLEELTRNPKARLEQVVSVLETDPGLSVRLLRLVNSAGYGLKVRVTSVRHAAVLVGTRRLHQVATTAAILDLFEPNNDTALTLLEHATVVGSLCRYLAVHLGLPHDELFTCGFLHDIGKLMLLDTEGEKYAELVRTYGGAPDQLHSHERRLFGFDHALLGAHVLSAWNIPEPVPKVVLYHHQPARAMQDTLLSAMVHTLRLADLISYALALEVDAEGISLVTDSEAAQYLEISEPQVAAMWSDLRALADRSRARSNGQSDLEVVAPRRLEVPRSLRPRRSGAPRSLPPSGTLPAANDLNGSRPSEVNEVPAHFPCVACSKPSYGNTCPACRGQVCPEHQQGPDHWCVLCAREYDKFREKNAVPVYLKVTGLTLAGFSVGASVTGVMVSQTFAVWKLIVAPLTMLLLWGVLLPVAHRLWQRKRFVRTRPKGRVPLPIKLPRPNPVFISSLDANLQNEGLLGASLAPQSRGGISIVGVSVAPAASLVVAPIAVASPPDSITGAAHADREGHSAMHDAGSESGIVLAAEAPAAPKTDRSPADPSANAPRDSVSQASPAASRERELDQAAALLTAKSDLILQPGPVPLRGAAVSLNPASAQVSIDTASSLPVALPMPKDSVAAHIASLLGEPSEGLSEFPSVGSETELEHVVASVSARLARDFPQNDYMGPSAELRAATIAPASEGHSPYPPVSIKMPLAPVMEAAAPVMEAAAPVMEATAPVMEAAAPVIEASPVVSDATPALAPEALPARLVMPRNSLEHGCAPRHVFRCLIPVAESCSPAPRRTSLRPSVQPCPAGETVAPNTIRGLG